MSVIATARASAVALVAATLALHAQAPAPAMPKGQHVLIGRVVDAGHDTPVAGAIVAITGHFDASGTPLIPDPIEGAPQPTVSAMTTSSGYFVFRDLPPGRYTARIRAHGYINSDYPPTLIEIPSGAKATELRLQVFKFAAMGGRVLDESGDPIAGLPVSALRRTLAGGLSILERVATVSTDDRGVYRIPQLTPGDYVVAVLSEPVTMPAHVAAALDPSPANRETFTASRRALGENGFSRTYGCPTCIAAGNEGHQVGNLVLQRPGLSLPPGPDGVPLGFSNTFYPATSRASEATFVALGSGDRRTDLDLSVRLVGTIAVSGVLIGPEGPMPDMSLQLAAPGTNLGDYDRPVASAVTDARGAFTFLGITPGEYGLHARQWKRSDGTTEGRLLWASQTVTAGDSGVGDLSVVMRPGIRTSGRVQFRTSTGKAPQPGQRHTILLQPIRATGWNTLEGVVRADGTFSTGGDPPGRYVINSSTARMPGWYWQTTTLGGKPVVDETIELESADVSDLVLTFGPATNRIAGQVTTGSGTPDPNAAVIVIAADSTPWREGIFSSSRRVRKVQASSDGSYDIATLSPGEYYVMAVPARLALHWQNPQFLERLVGGATRVTLGPEDTRTVALRAIVPSGK